jgi:hypothetical protein
VINISKISSVSSLSFQNDEEELELETIRQINELIKSGRSEKALFELLSKPLMGLEDYIFPFAASLYLSELNYIYGKLGHDLKKTNIIRTCKFLFEAVRINGSVSDKNIEEFRSLITDSNSELVKKRLYLYSKKTHYLLI